MHVDMDALPNPICKVKGQRLLTFIWTFVVFGLLKFFLDPPGAVNDLIMAMVLWCGITTGSYLMLVIYQVIFVTHAITVTSMICGYSQTNFSKLNGMETRMKLIIVVHIITVVIQTIGMP